MSDEKKSNPDNTEPHDEVTNSWWAKFKREWANAFAMRVPEDEFSEDDMKMIDEIAKDITDRGLASAAIMFLVSIHPLSFIMSQGMQMVKPFVPGSVTQSTGRQFSEKFILTSIITNPKVFERFTILMERRESIDRMVDCLEKHEDERIRNMRKKK